MDELTLRQAEILAWIRARMAEDSLPPTRAELMRAFAFRSPNAAESHLRVLARKGYILLQSGTARGIRLCASAAEEIGLPLIGRVAAGQPMLADEFREGSLPVDPRLFSPGADYLLRVQGMSMRDAGVLDGDILAVRHEAALTLQNGQMVVARVNGEVTVKRWKRDGDQVWLLPENPDFLPISVDLQRDNLMIEGVVVGLLRIGAKL
ncbi:SOS-response transcriptional repressor, LexA [Acidithiobacillus ferrivorans SS3]|jgi:repressor LexA|uniref:LexA repressor n=1 Tax=Acidithiobacillus ferrivorans SS3 TaxID=743299 RepID=G0JR24_9PROT|nr:transcriptional repressor LexA [Acidithiobacillus ferrivorans]MBN6739240.1 repressor LexA [Acidithiobacillus sp. MC6.1]AEM47557.1 SOS-response transcriptional repressor, LexA [Acidithiobacillus ferrivorans SS3]MBU2766375.1 repressor LexA [Acidithiobacillus ferrivorans]MBU2850677.1 repressor LexA [Acidithiobacillus ferrivorans]OFA15037.1 LexA repressor [Acidithiobacillus ferrivorans]